MLDQAISAIYACASARDPWMSLAQTVRPVAEANSITICRGADPNTSETQYIVDADWDFSQDLDQFRSTYNRLHPLTPARMTPGRIYDLDYWMAPAALHETRLWREYCAPRGLEHGLFCYLGHNDGIGTWLTAGRNGRDGPFGPAAVRRIDDLLPHIMRSAEVATRLEQCRQEADIYGAAISALGVGVAILNRTGEIVTSNPSARELLAVPPRPDLATPKQHLLSMRLQLMALPGTQSCKREIESAGRRTSMVLKRLPWSKSSECQNAVAFIAYFRQHDAPLTPRLTEMLLDELDFSPAEARLAILLAEGCTMEKAASRLHITRETARTYCKRALSKAGLSRQVDLVRMILNSLARLA